MIQLAFLFLFTFVGKSVNSQSAPESKPVVNVRMFYVNYPYGAAQDVSLQQDLHADCFRKGYVSVPPQSCSPPQVQKVDLYTAAEGNPLVAALLLSKTLGLHPKAPGFNHPEHLPLNPYVALLLSHYGRYAPIHGTGRGLYGYAAANNYHNNKPFGAYKIYEDNDA